MGKKITEEIRNDVAQSLKLLGETEIMRTSKVLGNHFDTIYTSNACFGETMRLVSIVVLDDYEKFDDEKSDLIFSCVHRDIEVLDQMGFDVDRVARASIAVVWLQVNQIIAQKVIITRDL